MTTDTIDCTYGSDKTEDIAYTYISENTGVLWYVVDGSENVNATHDELYNGVDVEEVSDIDCFTNSQPIESEDQLKREVDDFEGFGDEEEDEYQSIIDSHINRQFKQMCEKFSELLDCEGFVNQLATDELLSKGVKFKILSRLLKDNVLQ